MKRQIDIKLGNKEFTVSVTFAVVERIEQRVNLVEFLRQIQSYRPVNKDVAWVIYSAIPAEAKQSYHDVGEMCLDYPQDATGAATDICLQIMSTPESDKKKDEEPQKKVKAKK